MTSLRSTVRPACRGMLMTFLGAMLLSVGCDSKRSTPAPQVALPKAAVRVVKAEVKTRVQTDEVVGTVRASVRASVEAKVMGRIEWLNLTPGQGVKAGDVLARLDTREVSARLEQARVQLEQAERELKRFTSLLQQNAVTRQEYDVAESRARSARAAVTEVETWLGYAQLSAPFDGVVTRKWVEVGDLAVPGKALAEVEDPRSLRVEADIPETMVGGLQLGTQLPIGVPSLGKSLMGVVGEIAPVGDANSRTFLVKLDVPSASGLRAGLFVRVSVPSGESRSIYVPETALRLRGQLEQVFVLDQGVARLRLVRVGKRSDGGVEVTSGVLPGESVVVDGLGTLVDGQPVEVRP